MAEAKMIKRSDKVAFWGIKDGETIKFHRMTNMTDFSTSKNPKEFTRQYVDEEFEQTDVVGYSTSISTSIDEYAGIAWQEDLVDIIDNEMLGSEAVRSIVVVYLNKPGTTDGTFIAKKNDFSVIADSEGDGLEGYKYNLNLKVKSKTLWGTANSTDGWNSCTFAEKVVVKNTINEGEGV